VTAGVDANVDGVEDALVEGIRDVEIEEVVEAIFDGVAELLVEPVELEDEWVLVGVVEDPNGSEMIGGIMLVIAPTSPLRPAALVVAGVLEVIGFAPSKLSITARPCLRTKPVSKPSSASIRNDD